MIDDQQAQAWVASEFQKRMGGVRPVATVAQLARTAVGLIQNLEQNKVVDLPPEVDRVTYLAGLAADWVVAQSAACGTNVSREEALTWVRAELLEHLKARIDDPRSDARAVAAVDR